MPEEKNKKEAFVILPKKLFTDPKFKKLSPVSVIIYSILADRASLSQANDWKDENGRVFVYFAINEMAKLIGCGRNKVINCYKELEENGIIERKRQGQGKASLIYVNPVSDLTSRSCKMKLQEV